MAHSFGVAIVISLNTSWINHKPMKCLSTLLRTGLIMTSGRSWGRYMFPTVFSMIKGENTFNLYPFLHPPSFKAEVYNPLLNVSVGPAGTLLWAVWTTAVAMPPSRWWMRGGWRDTGRPTSWRTKKRSETPASDVVTLCTVSPVAEEGFQILYQHTHTHTHTHSGHKTKHGPFYKVFMWIFAEYHQNEFVKEVYVRLLFVYTCEFQP